MAANLFHFHKSATPGIGINTSTGSGLGPSAPRRSPTLACNLGWLRAVAHNRVPPAAPARGLFRIDGSGDEYGRGVCGGRE